MDSWGIYIENSPISVEDFFIEINGIGLKFIYLNTCNSVKVVSAFRRTDINALIAASEDLAVNYADHFEVEFYKNLGNGANISTAFNKAALICEPKDNEWYGIRTRSGIYDPMFLDLRKDFSFKESY